MKRHRDQKWRTGPIHRSPATEAGDDGEKDRWPQESLLTLGKDRAWIALVTVSRPAGLAAIASESGMVVARTFMA